MSDTETEMTPEPDWLAAEPTARAKLTAIMDAVRQQYTVSRPPCDRNRPCLTITMAEVFIGQMLMKVAADEREGIRELAAGYDARYFSDGHSHAFADLLAGHGDG